MTRLNGNGKKSFDRRVRTITPQDVPAFAEFLERSGPVTGEFARSVPSLLRRLIADETLHGVAVEYIFGNGVPPEPAAFGLSGFVTKECAAKYLASPSPHIALLLLHQELHDRKTSPFLTLQEVAEANADGGLTLIPLCWFQRTYDQADPEAHALLAIGQQTFFSRHLGYRLNRIIKEVPAQVASAFLGGGFEELCRFPTGTPLAFYPDAALTQDHIVFTITKENVQGEWPGKAIGRIFAYEPPRCAFTRSEQQVLMSAADGLTDARIAEELNITLTAVTLRWRSIYNRVAQHAPALLDSEEVSNGTRGHEKRRLVIAFVDEHPEELRPYFHPVRRHSKVAACQGRPIESS